MTATEIIEEIKRLEPAEQADVIRFVHGFDARRRLTGSELSALAQRMRDTTDPAEAAKMRESVIHGFYGERDA